VARLKFRVTRIDLDDDEYVSAVTAVIRDDTLGVVTQLIGEVDVLSSARGNTEMTVRLPAATVARLFNEVGQICGDDPRYDAVGPDVHDSLSMIVYRLMED
jgi:hypothetical protein